MVTKYALIIIGTNSLYTGMGKSTPMTRPAVALSQNLIMPS